VVHIENTSIHPQKAKEKARQPWDLRLSTFPKTKIKLCRMNEKLGEIKQVGEKGDPNRGDKPWLRLSWRTTVSQTH
jgi:hypothetical protein